MPHYPGHLLMGMAALAATLVVQALTVNRVVQRKLRLSVALLAAYVVLNALLAILAAERLNIGDEDLRAFERLMFAAGLINLLVVSAVNPLHADRVPDRFPTILQDFLVIGLVLLTGTFLSDKLIATSAVSAVVVGFALQDTLGNAFAGLAIQSDAPFHVGNWVRVGGFEGRVSEITWRATKLRTKSGNFIIVPNNKMTAEAIVNFTEPAVPTRLEVEVGASYTSAPNDVKAAILEAIGQVPRALKAPAPDALLLSFDDSAITYRARFWVLDYEFDDEARDEVRRAIYYSFARNGIEIPWPIEVGYLREWPETAPPALLRQREDLVNRVDLFARLSGAQRQDIAARATLRTFGSGEAIVREGEPGQSMFVVCSGCVRIVVGADRREVAVTEAGGYFGEMSLLTGEPRSATVVARGDASVLEIDAEAFRALAAADPQAVEAIGLAAVARRSELDQVRSSEGNAAAAAAPATFLARMRKFLRRR